MYQIDEYTKLMLHMNGVDGSQTFVDSSYSNHTVTAIGTAQIDTEHYVFGGASGLFLTTGNHLSIPDSNDFYLGYNNFTIDLRLMVNTLSDGNSRFLLRQQQDSNNRWFIILSNSGGNINLSLQHFPNSPVADINMSVTLGSLGFSFFEDTFYHLALVREGNNFKIFLNGVQKGLTYVNANDIHNINAPLTIGERSSGTLFLSTWIDELQFSNGISRWSEDFTPPDSEYIQVEKKELTPSLEWSILNVNSLYPALSWNVFSEEVFVPNLINYPLYFDIPSIRSSRINVGFSGCLAAYSIYLKNTGSDGQTTIDLYVNNTLIETIIITANGNENNYFKHTELDKFLSPGSKLDIKIREVASNSQELTISFYQMTFPFNLEISNWGNTLNNIDFFGLKKEYLFGFVDSWFIELNQPILSIDYVRIIDTNGQEFNVGFDLSKGNFYNSRIKLDKYTHSNIDHIRLRVKDVFSNFHILEFKPIYSLYSSDFPENFSKSLSSFSEVSEDVTGFGLSFATENNSIAYKAVDNISDNTSYWISETHLNNPNGLPQSWAYDFGLGNEKIITRLNIKPYIDSNGLYIKNFQIWGSNLSSPDLTDDSDWEALFGGNCLNILSFQSFSFYNITSYRWYRIKVTSNYRSDAYTELGRFDTGIDELEMFESIKTDNSILTVNNWLDTKYFRYSFDNGDSWTEWIEVNDFQQVFFDFSNKSTGSYSILVQYLKGSDIVEDSFTLFYTADELEANIQLLGESAKITYSDNIPFNRVEVYYDSILNKIETPNIYYNFSSLSTDAALKQISIETGNFYYQNKVYTWDGSVYTVQPNFSLGTVSFTVVFGFNTQTLEFEFIESINEYPSFDKEIVISDFIALKRIDYLATPTSTDYSTYNIQFGANFSYVPQTFVTLDLTTNKDIEIRLYDIVGRYISFLWRSNKIKYNIWRTLTVTPGGGGSAILPGEIHQYDSLDYSIDSEI